MSEPDSAPKSASYVVWLPLLSAGIIGSVAAFAASDLSATRLVLGLIAITMTLVAVIAIARIARLRRRR